MRKRPPMKRRQNMRLPATLAWQPWRGNPWGGGSARGGNNPWGGGNPLGGASRWGNTRGGGSPCPKEKKQFAILTPPPLPSAPGVEPPSPPAGLSHVAGSLPNEPKQYSSPATPPEGRPSGLGLGQGNGFRVHIVAAAGAWPDGAPYLYLCSNRPAEARHMPIHTATPQRVALRCRSKQNRTGSRGRQNAQRTQTQTQSETDPEAEKSATDPDKTSKKKRGEREVQIYVVSLFSCVAEPCDKGRQEFTRHFCHMSWSSSASRNMFTKTP